MSERNLKMARDAWGDDLPSWVELLARESDRTSQSEVARKLRYSSGGVVGEVLRKRWTGSYDNVRKAVEGAFQAATVRCPVVGDIASHACLEHQRAPYASTNPIRVRLYRACRSGCPHSGLKTREH